MSCADGFALLLTCSCGSSNPDGTVGYATRRCLHDASDGDHGPRFARIFSGVLAIDCARQSFGLWQDSGGWSALGDFARIGLADLGVAASPDDARNWLARAEAEVMQAYYDGTPRFQNTAGLAGLSCLRGVGACIGRFRFDPDGDEEIDIEPDHWDSAFLSACALAGGAPWQCDDGTSTDEAARSAFWRWYLAEAVPRAYAEAAQRCAGQGE